MVGANIQSNPSLRAPATIANLIVRREAQLAKDGATHRVTLWQQQTWHVGLGSLQAALPPPCMASHSVHCPIRPKPQNPHLESAASSGLDSVQEYSTPPSPSPPGAEAEHARSPGTGSFAAGNWYNFGQELEKG